MVDDMHGRPYTQARMKERKVLLIISGFWQLVRFVLVVLSANVFLNPRLATGTTLLLVWPASASLVLGAAYFFAGVFNHRFIALRGFLIFGKMLDVIPGLLLLLFQAAALFWGVLTPLFDVVPLIDRLTGFQLIPERLFYYVLAVIVLFDLIFLLILLSYKTDAKDREPDRKSAPGENLPEYEITRIEED